MAPVAVSALGIFGALLMILGGVVALNHSVLPFNGWPTDGQRFDIQKQQLPRAPVATGRLRTAPGGALAGALGNGSSLAHGEPLASLLGASQTVIGPRPPARRVASRPVSPGANVKSAPQPPAPAPRRPPVPAVTPAPAATPVVTPGVVAPAPVSRLPTTSSAVSGNGNGNGHANGHSHAPGQLKKAAAAAAAPAVVAQAAVDRGNHHGNGGAGQGDGGGHGHGNGGGGDGNRGGNGHGGGDGDGGGHGHGHGGN